MKLIPVITFFAKASVFLFLSCESNEVQINRAESRPEKQTEIDEVSAWSTSLKRAEVLQKENKKLSEREKIALEEISLKDDQLKNMCDSISREVSNSVGMSNEQIYKYLPVLESLHLGQTLHEHLSLTDMEEIGQAAREYLNAKNAAKKELNDWRQKQQNEKLQADQENYQALLHFHIKKIDQLNAQEEASHKNFQTIYADSIEKMIRTYQSQASKFKSGESFCHSMTYDLPEYSNKRHLFSEDLEVGEELLVCPSSRSEWALVVAQVSEENLSEEDSGPLASIRGLLHQTDIERYIEDNAGLRPSDALALGRAGQFETFIETLSKSEVTEIPLHYFENVTFNQQTQNIHRPYRSLGTIYHSSTLDQRMNVELDEFWHRFQFGEMRNIQFSLRYPKDYDLFSFMFEKPEKDHLSDPRVLGLRLTQAGRNTYVALGDADAFRKQPYGYKYRAWKSGPSSYSFLEPHFLPPACFNDRLEKHPAMQKIHAAIQGVIEAGEKGEEN